MNGNKAILDSDAIIYASKGLVDVESMLSGYDNSFASIVTFIEVYAYEFADDEEKAIVDEIMDGIEIVDLDRAIADQSILYRKNRVKKIKLPDAVILATAKVLNADLITNNVNDFDKIDPSLTIIGLIDFEN